MRNNKLINTITSKISGKFLLLISSIALLVIASITATVKNVTASSNAAKKELPIYCVECDTPKISISFDAAWGNDDTSRILEILANNNVKATFFVTGGWVNSYPDDVKTIYAAGHDIGNHSQNHKDMPKLSATDQRNELMSVHNKVKELTGYDMFLFRPPYGSYCNSLITTARDCGYYTIQWDVETLVMNM